jgi:hypothetical protein
MEIVNYVVMGLADDIMPTSWQRQHKPDNHGREQKHLNANEEYEAS